MEDKRIYDGFKGAVQNFAQYEMLDSYSFFSGLGKNFPIYTYKNYIATTTDTLERTQEKMLKNMSAAQKTVKHAHSGSSSF
ncbi:hypothetical protein [[Clostridium] aminophilum]|uniref:Uncharacterized protein n=1 Tax=[Clostridium] aminophilum TaxID=1526 RepID=A0A1I6ITH4_9FIRM|nr:hypothetical protein [[Clostridium] aminophilum]SFR69530.1 hypothetical protein SAMN02910262_00721 [[Clostridium] aminophilum]